GSLMATVLFLGWGRQKFALPRWREIREPMRYSTRILTGNLSWWAYSNADFVVAGRFLGKGPLGAYSLAWTVASMPIDRITGIVTKVTPAYFSALQHDNRALRRQLLMLTEAIAMLTLPASLGMALVASDFIHAALGDQWVDAIVPLQLLCLYASLRSITTLLP